MLRPLACLLSLSFVFTAAAAPAPPPLRVTGRILPPVPIDLRVELIPLVSGYAEAARFLAGEPIPPLATAQPRADGSFEILAPESGLYRVRLQAEKYLPVEVLLIPLVEDTELPPVTLQTAPALQITVLGPDGRPVPHLRLRALSVQAFGRGTQIAWRPAQSDGVTDAMGTVNLPQGGVPELSLVALAAGVPDRFVEKIEGSRHTLRLKQSEPRVVEVRGRDGKPLAGALIRWNLMPFGFTGSDGRLALPAATSGATLRLEDSGGFLAEVPVAPEDKGLIAVRLPTGRTVTGRVLDAVSRAPLPGALVWGGDHRHVHAAADGRFSLRVFGTGEVTVDAAAAGHLSSPAQARPDEQLVTCALRPATVLNGMVTDETGHPVPGAEIRAQQADRRRPQADDSSLSVRSGADGRFRLAGLAAGEMFEVTAQREGFATATLPVEASHAGKSSPLRIVLRRGALLAGRVVNAGGEPVAGAEIILRSTSWRRARSSAVKVLSDAAGHFRCADLNAGLFDLRASRRGFAATVVRGVEIPAVSQPAQTPPMVDLGDLVLVSGAVIEGRVVDHRGAPISKAEVDLSCSDFFPWGFSQSAPAEPLVTGADGRFRVEDLTPGAPCNLDIRHAGYTQARLPGVNVPTREPLRIELATARVLSGRVVGPLGEPVPRAAIALSESSEIRLGGGGVTSSTMSEGGGRTDAEGRFRIDGLASGLVNLTVSAAGYKKRTLPGIEIPETGGPALEISLSKGETLTGRVVDSHGEPVAGATLYVSLEELMIGDFQQVEGTTDGDGRYRLEGLEIANYSATATNPDGETLEASVKVRPGINPLDFTFPGGVDVTGRVLDRDGVPVPGATASLTPVAGGKVFHAVAGAEGFFHIRTVADGDYRLAGQAEGFAATTQPGEIHVAGQAVQDLELRLDRGTVLTGKLIGVTPEQLGMGSIHASNRSGSGFGLLSAQIGVAVGDGYRIADLYPGTWEVTAFTSDHRFTHGSVVIEPGMDRATLDLEFTTGLTLSGRVLVDGAPLIGAQVYVQGSAGSTPSGGNAMTVWDGSFRITGLAPGRYRIVIAGHSGIGHSEEIEISEDREATFEIVTGSLSGEVLSTAGTPVAGALVSLSGENPELASSFGGPALRSDE
ncbi:MAG TPA: carboxypeptidase regulatory-like domain-containing protein, partial [Thermoanaerobaculia bacterium]|nr:carboxypeptidase regulatory-like domain-containing protein [Thermoanaerobaculia bacterium]